MADQTDKARRKQILNNFKQKAKEDFENSLPTSRGNFQNLFDYLDDKLTRVGCNDTNILTRDFLTKINAGDVEKILAWLADKGGYCDCEILGNVEELFE